MSKTFKNFFSQVIHAVSKGLKLPYILVFVIRVLSNLQIMALVLSDTIFSSQEGNFNGNRSLGPFLSAFRSAMMFPKMQTQTMANIVFYICSIYIFLQMVGMIYFIFTVHQGNKLRSETSKACAFVGFVHSHVLFFPIHCIFLRFIHLHLNCNDQDGTLFYCNIQWLIIPSIFGVVSFILAFIRELFCNEIRNQKDACAIKDNLHPLLQLTQKSVIIPLIYFLAEPETLVVTLNIVACLLSLYMLQRRLPYYHLKILRLEIVFSSLNLLCSLFMLAQVFGDRDGVLFIMIFASTLTTKLSLLYHDRILFRILKSPRLKDPYKAVHLPILIREYLKQITKYPRQGKFSTATLYISEFLKGRMDNIRNLEWNGIPQEAKTEAYLLVKSKLQSALKTHPNNELLLFSIIRIYKKLKDVPEAISLLNRMRTYNLSISMSNAAEDLYKELEGLHEKSNQESTEKLNFMNYFEYRKQSSKLKYLMQEELKQQIMLWQMFNQNSVDANQIISQAKVIDCLQSRIEGFWQKTLQSLEQVYVGAPLLYGLYLDVIQCVPYIGATLMQKSYEQILKKSVFQNDIMDIFIGNSACIIISTESERPGRVVDASSSVKELFEVDRGHIIGSNIKALLPKAIAEKHDELIQNFHAKFQKGLSCKFSLYARTLKDKYFAIELILRPLHSINQGLNVVAYMRKLSNNVSIMIVDYNGKVVECSKDLQILLSNEKKEGYKDLAHICADLVKVNQAFNIVYAPQQQTPAQMQNDANMVSEEESAYIQVKTPHNYIKSEENRLLSASDALSTRLVTGRPSKEIEETSKILRISIHSEKGEIKDIPPVLPRNISDYNNAMTHEEAQVICNLYKEKKILKFNLSKDTGGTVFESQIEPLFFAGSMYKVIKVNKLKTIQKPNLLVIRSKSKRKSTILQSMTHSKNSENVVLDLKSSFAQGDIDAIDDNDALEESNIIELANQSSSDDSEEEDHDNNNKQLMNLKIHIAKSNSHKSKAHSVIDSTSSVRTKVSRISHFFRNPKLTYATKVACIMVYLSILLVLVSACINMIFTRQSLNDIDDTVSLINFTNARLYKLIAAWRAALVIYSRSVGVRPPNAALVLQYQGVTKSATLDMLNNNNLLQSRINDFRSKTVTHDFYDKQVSLWVPYENRITDNQKVDSFTASQIISMNNMFIANWNGSVVDLKGRSEVLFALNNSANDYILAVDDSNSDMNSFFEQTQSSNNKLLTAMIVLETLALIVPFISLRALFKVVFTGHKNLFKAISKIRKSNVEERIRRLAKMTEHLKGDIEDCLLFYQDYLSPDPEHPAHVKPANKADKITEMAYTRVYTLKGLVLNMSKYFIFTFIPVSIILILFWLSYSSSIQGLSDLHRINTQLVKTYEYGGEISLILSSFFYIMIFLNQPEYKIRNDDPANQLKRSFEYLANANNELVSMLSLSGQSIEDPEIENLLKNNLCSYLPPEHLQMCLDNTQRNSIGLLGMNSKYYQGYAIPILNFINYNRHNLTAAMSLFNAIGKTFGDIHDVTHDGYEALAKIVFSNFKNAVAQKLSNNMIYFECTAVIIIVSMLLIKTVVIKNYQQLELSVFKILKLIPYDVIESNKAISFYLAKKFAEEFSGKVHI